MQAFRGPHTHQTLYLARFYLDDTHTHRHTHAHTGTHTHTQPLPSRKNNLSSHVGIHMHAGRLTKGDIHAS